MSVCKYGSQPARLPWKQLQQHSHVTNFTPSDIYWHHLWNFGADNNSHARRAASTTLAQWVASGWLQLATLLNNFGYALRLRAGKQWFVAPFSRSHSGSRWRAGSWTSALFSSWPGLRGEGAPGGLRGRRGHRGDSGADGDISEQWVTDSVQILINPRRWKRPLRRARHHGQSAREEFLYFCWLFLIRCCIF